MATLAIQLGVAVGVSVLSSALAPKAKLQPVDKGKLDDIRFTFIEEGGFKPLVYGRRVRLGGVIRWGTKTKEHLSQTPGRSGGKGGTPQAAEPPTNTYTYTKSFAIRVCGNQIKAFRNVWENEELILSFAGADGPGDYEAEAAGNTLAGAVVFNTPYASGGRSVRLNTSGGAIQFNGVTGFGALTEFGFGYVASGTRTCQVWVNGSLARTVTLPGGGERVVWYKASDLDIPAGAANTVRLVNTSSASGAFLWVDRLYVNGEAISNEEPYPTGVVNETDPFPADKTYPLPAYNAVAEPDGVGFIEGMLAWGGQAPFELYLGTETQLQSPTIVAAEGAANVPAWRGDAYFVARDYLLRGGQLGNFTFEVEPLIQDVAQIMLDLYRQDGRTSDEELDFSAMAGTLSEGFVVHTRDELGKWIDQLQEWYGFEVVPVDGKIVAVRRGAAPSFTLTEDDLCAHREGEERPLGAVRQTHADVRDEPATVDVLYLEPSAEKMFHTGAQHAQVQVGDSYDHETLTFAVVGDPDTAHAVGQRWLDRKALEAHPLAFAAGPKWRHLVPTDVGDIVLKGVSRRVRIISSEAELQGLVRFRAIPERASIYTQDGVGQRAIGREAAVVAFPANTLLVVADCVALRQEDFGRLVLHAAACPLGSKLWPGYHLIKKDQNDEYERLGGFQDAATVGVVETASQSATFRGYDATRSFVVKLYYGALESRTLDEVLAERVNLALYGKGTRWEVLQFLSAVPQTPAAPYVAQYLVTGTVSGLLGSEQNSRNHQDGDHFVLVDSAVKSFPVPPADLNHELTFIGQTAGQALADAETVSSVTLTLAGVSRKYSPPATLRLQRLNGSNGAPLLISWDEPGGAMDERYLVRIESGGEEQRRHPVTSRYNEPLQATLVFGSSSLATIAEDGTVESPGHASNTATLLSNQIVYGDSRVVWHLGGKRPPKQVRLVGATVPCSRDTGTNEVVAIDHHFGNYDQVVFSGGSPLLGAYYVKNAKSDRFQISLAPGGSTVSLAGTPASFKMSYPSPTTSPAFASLDALILSGSVYVRPMAYDDLRRPATAGTPCVIEVSNGVLKFYVGDMETPVLTAGAFPVRFPYQIEVVVGAVDGQPQGAYRMTVQHVSPRSFLYTRGMQENDFGAGSIPATVDVFVSRLSDFGEGIEASATG